MNPTGPMPPTPSGNDAGSSTPPPVRAQGTGAAESAAPDSAPVKVVRRLQRMVPRPPAEGDTGPVVNRDVLANASRSTVKPQTRRNRQLVGTLPGWEPLPPGEVMVSKPRTAP